MHENPQQHSTSELSAFRKNYLITGVLHVPVIMLGVYSDFYLQKSPENFTNAVIALFHYTQNLELSYRLNSAILSVGSDVSTTACAFLSVYTLSTVLNDQLTKFIIPESDRDLLDTKDDLFFYASIIAAITTGIFFILLEISKTETISRLDWGDILAFSVPMIATFFYMIRVYSKSINNV